MARESQIKTKLTGRGAGLLLLSLALVAAGAVAPWPDAVRVGLLGICLPPAAWFFARRNLQGLRLERKLPATCFAGQLFSMDLTLMNDRPRLDAFGIDVEDGVSGPTERGMTAAWVASRGGSSTRTFTTRLLRRGDSLRATARLTSVWPLGLWRSTLDTRDRLPVTIFPRPAQPRTLEEAVETANVDVDEAESVHRDWMGDFHGVRAFQPGDRLKQIHWPSSARSRDLMVRQYDRPLPEKYFIVFHSITTGHPGENNDAFEGAMELLCGLMLHCQERSIPMDLVASFLAWQRYPVHTPAAMEGALHRLAGARRHGEKDPAAMMAALSEVDRHTRIFIISDIPVKEWEPLLPEVPYEITCLSVADLRIRRPGRVFRMAPAPQSPQPNP